MTARIPVGELERRVGGEIGVSRWFAIDQARIDSFADVIDDHQFIHVDPERARRDSPFGGTIAHGFLSLSLLTAMGEGVLPEIAGQAMVINYGFDRVRFLAPVKSGARVRARFVLSGADRRSERELVARYAVTVEVEGGGKPALAADWIILTLLEEQVEAA
ncbi:MaoC family dehydratase [Azospirillum doebereinerae]|uniref:MaoC family dehydratase n=1 Tax=Azospirillum doebereinerae TaxID=92933 RepID=A0A3S0XJD2_9PROT|nr:MaoC family dehydratase [Azospirillum doebereinerae]RUQ65133.1 MaoC family dehydratase [Azospirillum doebereinerae]